MEVCGVICPLAPTDVSIIVALLQALEVGGAGNINGMHCPTCACSAAAADEWASIEALQCKCVPLHHLQGRMGGMRSSMGSGKEALYGCEEERSMPLWVSS